MSTPPMGYGTLYLLVVKNGPHNCSLDPLYLTPLFRCGCVHVFRIQGGELFEDIVQREHYSEADARLDCDTKVRLVQPRLTFTID